MNNSEDIHRYDDIINLPHHVSKSRKQMSLHDRAAQFSPFAALTGYGDAVHETARLTDEYIELDDGQKDILNAQLKKLYEHIAEHPDIKLTYFLPDSKKSGGAYTTISGNVKKIDTYKRTLVFQDKTEIPFDNIYKISGWVFDKMI